MLIKHSRIIGIICAALNMLPWVYVTAYEIYILSLPANEAPFESQGYASVFLPFLIVPALLISLLGLWGSLIVHKKPTAGLVLMFVSGGIFVPLAVSYFWWLGIASLLLIAAGVLAFLNARKTSVSRNLQNKDIDPATRH